MLEKVLQHLLLLLGQKVFVIKFILYGSIHPISFLFSFVNEFS